MYMGTKVFFVYVYNTTTNHMSIGWGLSSASAVCVHTGIAAMFKTEAHDGHTVWYGIHTTKLPQ